MPLVTRNSGGDQPSFRNTVSAGDRNTLALAFFLASLDSEADLGNLTVVIDDPVSSLDDARALATVQEVRRLSRRAEQVIVLSHTKSFLCRMLNHAQRDSVTCLSLARRGEDSSILEVWEATEDEFTMYYQRHKLLRDFRDGRAPDIRQVAQALRPVMEGYLRVAFPEHCPPGTMLGRFREKIQTQIDAGNQVMTTDRLLALDDIREYANKFHHEPNGALETEEISDMELLNFVNRVMDFITH